MTNCTVATRPRQPMIELEVGDPDPMPDTLQDALAQLKSLRTELQEAIARAQAAEGRAEAAEVRTPAAALDV